MRQSEGEILLNKSMINVRGLLFQLRQGWKRILGCVLASCLLSLAYLAMAEPVYESDALLRIKQQQGNPSVTGLVESLGGGTVPTRKERMSTYAEILRSRNVMEPVIEANGGGSYEAFTGRVMTTPLKDTEILKVTVSDTDPARAQELNKEIMDSFLSRLTVLSHEEKKVTKEFLEGRVTEADTALTEAEDKLQKYQLDQKFVSPEEHLKELISRLSSIKKEEEANKVDLAAAQAGYQSVSGQLSSYGSALADNATIRQYNTKLADLEVERIGYLEKYTAEHPKMVAINEKIAEARRARDAEVSRVASQAGPSENSVQQSLLRDALMNQAKIAVDNSKAAALAAANASAEEELSAMPAKEQGFVRAQRDVNVAQDIYTMLYKRLEDAKIAEVMVPNEVQLIDEPTLPESPVRPHKRKVIMLFGVLGLLAGLLSVIVPLMLRRRIDSPADVEAFLEMEVIGSVPDFDSLGQPEIGQPAWYKGLRRK
ncbi:Uncharacterized protein involved in exopolysaccharide biosynthesis [Selenomonas sp. KH1T6]|nr:Uncharacterized protein involved in exopolysaccharide biosynthesis [Selenomonas ruminantium]